MLSYQSSCPCPYSGLTKDSKCPTHTQPLPRNVPRSVVFPTASSADRAGRGQKSPWQLLLNCSVHPNTSLPRVSCTWGLPYTETEAGGNNLPLGLQVGKPQSQTALFVFLGTEQPILKLALRTHLMKLAVRGCRSKSQECLLAEESGCETALRK